MTTLEYLETSLEHAPKSPGPLAPNLVGWSMDEGKLTICAHCAGRILARGCHLPRDSEPLWHGPVAIICCLCKETKI